MKRLLDITLSLFGLLFCLPILLPLCIAVYFQDFKSPFYIASRVGRGGRFFQMVKLRSMVQNAAQSGVDSTSNNDPRITRVGRFIRSFKLDEIPQLWNVLKGEMSLVGPRPNVLRNGTELYTDEENLLLNVRPGMTDLASIVFSDEGSILEGCVDPDLTYNQLIRPWKSKLGILYVKKNTILIDFQIVVLTIVAIISRQSALTRLQGVLKKMGADEELLKIALRNNPLVPHPPPGAQMVYTR